MSIEIKGLCKSYNEKIVLNNYSVTLPEIGVVTLFGPSGCGKTTLLNLIAGLDTPDSGEIIGLDGKRLSIVFQEDRLLPWISVNKNISIVSPEENSLNTSELLKIIDLEDVGEKFPDELSGGMKRRVAIARALRFGGDLYLLDEPFKGLDNIIKEKIMKHIKLLSQKSLVLLITHDKAEADFLSDVFLTLA